MPEERHLSAIMFTDIVGYTSMMGKDEANAMQVLEQQRQFIKPLLAIHKGEMFKEIGDGTLSHFHSAVDAVECAIKIQCEVLKKTDFYIRIGIHVGDVVFKGGDIFGDGVNVASRLEPLAEPGGICISSSVYENIRNQTDLQAIYLGEKVLKNVASPVKVYAITSKGLPTPKVLFQKQVKSFSPSFRNIVFVFLAVVSAIFVIWYFFIKQPMMEQISSNLNDDQDLNNIENGLTENNITRLAKNSSSPYQGKSGNINKVTKEIRKKYAEKITRLEMSLAVLNTKIATIKRDLGASKPDNNDGLEAMLTMVDEKERQQQLLDELLEKWKQVIENDIAIYLKIIHSSSGKDLQETAWNKLVANYPEAVGLATGNVDVLKILLLKEWIDPITSMEFVLVEGGCFMMGDKSGDGDEDEKPVHEVCVDSFAMSSHEVTQGEWEKIMGNNPSRFVKGDEYPVEQVSWVDTQDFIRKLNSRSGISFRLPTEAEWEYAACSGDRKEKYYSGNDVDQLGWHVGNSGDSTHPVGTKKANGIGLYDMSGNVWEWCADWYDKNYYRQSLRNNPRGPSSGRFRVIRDGCWNGDVWLTRCTNRDGFRPGYRLDNLGFRIVFPAKQGN